MKTYKVTVGNDGTRWYNEEGQLHREGDLPAIEYADGDKWWYINGQLNREGGKPAVEWADGGKAWYINGEEVEEAEAIEYFKPKVKEVEWKTFLIEFDSELKHQQLYRFKSIDDAVRYSGKNTKITEVEIDIKEK
jgi:hypothetical protein